MLTSLRSPTGALIHVRRRLADSPRGVVQISHDAAEHGGRYGDFAAFLAARGFHVYAHDHRGHGRTKTPGTPRGSFGGAAMVEADLFELHELIARERPGLPVILFGQGAGALIAFDFLIGHAPRIAGAALWNMPVAAGYPARFLRAMLGWERFRLGSDVPSPTMRRITRNWSGKAGGGTTEFDWLSDDPTVVKAYIADPDCGFEPSISMWLDLLRIAARVGSPRLLSSLPRDLPFHLAAGSEDPVTDEGRQLERFAQKLKQTGFSNLVSRTYPGKRHDLVNSLNRSVKELNRNVIWEDFAEWADSVLSRTDSQ